jgi:hypothetical protein
MLNPPRLSADRALDAKIDPGTADTDPKFYCAHKTVTVDGWSTWDFTGVTSGKYLQDFWFQTKDAHLGDKVSVIFASDGTDTGTYGVNNTEVASFGECTVNMQQDASGWSPVVDKAAQFQTSKYIPAGLKVRVKYYATGSSLGNRELLFDALLHE